MSPTPRTVSVDMLTSSYRIVGELPVTNSGVLGVVGDTTSSYMEIYNTNLARIHMATKLVEQAPLVRVVKSQVIAVCVNRRDEVAPQIAARAGYSRIGKYPVKITSTIYETEGTFEWSGRFDFTAVMAEGSCEFITLYDATVGAILFPMLLIQSPIILFNRRFINTLTLVGEGA